MKKNYSTILFDFADTIAELQPGRQGIVSDYIRRSCGLQIESTHISRVYKTLDNVMPYSSVKTRSPLQRSEFYLQYNKQLLTLLGVAHLVSAEGLFAAFGGIEKHWKLKPGALKVLKECKKRGMQVGVVSNFDACLEKILREHLGLSDALDYIHVSQKEGLEKPDLGFYRQFFEKYQLSIENACYVGDSYLLDLQPALQLGMKAWLLDEMKIYAHLPEAIETIEQVLDQL